jgi:hypothetical protein
VFSGRAVKIDIRLKQILQRAGLDRRGVTQRIAADLKVHRHTIGKLYRNQLTHPSLKVLEALCDWLREKGVEEELPQALFGVRPAGFWQASAAFGKVTIYIGEYQQAVRPGPARRWIALRDAEAWGDLIEQFTSYRYQERAGPMLTTVHVPFRFFPVRSRRSQPEFEKDVAGAEKIHAAMRGQEGAAILIGSQRVNYLLELLVAELFGAKPFRTVAPHQRPKVPFFLVYHGSDRAVTSCFGARDRVPGVNGRAVPGTYYVSADNRWVSFPWKRYHQDAGILITSYSPGTKRLQVALFGYSGWATGLLGKSLCVDSDRFWPPQAETKRGRLVGVYVCKFKSLRPDESAGFASTLPADNSCEVVAIDPKVLKRYLS